MSDAVNWVAVQSGMLRASEEARDRVAGIRGGQPLNIVTILGAARHGKSFLMNALTGVDNVFRVSPDVVPCTAGADLSPILMPLPEFEGGGRGSNSFDLSIAPQPTVAFVDMEGQGDQATGHDVRLATPFLLLSQIVIFNWMGLPNKTTILQRLVMMVQAGEKVMERGDEGEPTFGHLILVVRDVKGQAAQIEALVMKDEHTGNLACKDGKEVLERNEIRKGLRKAFKSITVHTMHRPHPDIEDGPVPFSEVSPGFTDSLDQLRGVMAGHLKTPHTFGGEPITGGERLHDIVRKLCEMVNSTEDICPPSVLEAIDTRRAHQEVQSALTLFDVMLDYVKAGTVVLSTEEVFSAINDARDTTFDQLDRATQGISSRIAKEAREKLVNQIFPKAKVVADCQETKRRELTAKMQALVSKSEADVAKEALGSNASNTPNLATGVDEGMLEQRWDSIVSSRFDVLRRDLKMMATVNGVVNEALLAEVGLALPRSDFDGLVKGTHKQVQDLNRAAIAREEDRKAKEEADKAKEEADMSRDEANKAKEEADKAKQEADKAKDEADKSREEANKAEEAANKMKGEADKAKEEAEKAEEAAIKAKGEANKVKGEADKAKEEADKSREEADKARDEANKVKGEADKAKEGIKKAKVDADKARDEADKVKEEADKVKEEADKVKEEANKSVKRLADRITKLDEEIIKAEEEADKAKEEADNSARRLADRNEELEEGIKKAEEEADRAKDKNDKAKEEADNSARRLADRNEKLEEDIKKAEEEADRVKDKTDKAKDEADKKARQLAERIANLEEAGKTVKADAVAAQRHLNAQIVEARTERDQAAAAAAELQRQIDSTPQPRPLQPRRSPFPQHANYPFDDYPPTGRCQGTYRSGARMGQPCPHPATRGRFCGYHVR